MNEYQIKFEGTIFTLATCQADAINSVSDFLIDKVFTGKNDEYTITAATEVIKTKAGYPIKIYTPETMPEGFECDKPDGWAIQFPDRDITRVFRITATLEEAKKLVQEIYLDKAAIVPFQFGKSYFYVYG
jgi:hypothetical protein